MMLYKQTLSTSLLEIKITHRDDVIFISLNEMEYKFSELFSIIFMQNFDKPHVVIGGNQNSRGKPIPDLKPLETPAHAPAKCES